MRTVDKTDTVSGIQVDFRVASALPKPAKTSPRITLRLTERELATLKSLSSGMSLSAYVRKCVFGKEAKPRKIRARAPVENHQALAQVLGLLGQTRFANNLNQLAYHANSRAWGVSLRPGHHEGIISFEAFEKIQARLKTGGYAPARKDVNEDFPLRGFVACAGCSKPLTAAWSKGKRKSYPYYLCHNKPCTNYGKSLPRAKVEGQFEDILKEITPEQNLFQMVKTMVGQAWEQRALQSKAVAVTLRREITRIEQEIEGFLDRIVSTQNASVISAYENKIASLEREKLLAQEKLEKNRRPVKTKGQIFEHAMQFLSNPWKLWDSGNILLRKSVLRLAFT